jgi:hypothetical protein
VVSGFLNTELREVLASFDEFFYFPSIGWDHSWERQQTLISSFCDAHAPTRGLAVAPTGLIDHAPWHLSSLRAAFSRSANMSSASAAHTSNARPANLDYVAPRFSRGTNSIFASLLLLSNATLRNSVKPRGRRLVMASYVNPFVERYLESAAFTILDLAERRQANDALSAPMRELERKWAARADLLVADNAATLDDYAADRARAGKRPGYLIPQGFTPPAEPASMRGRGRIAAYLGNLHDAIDYDYFVALIDRNPDWTFKLCGQPMSGQAERLLSRPNVRYVGVISNAEIGDFLSDASIGLIPYLRTEWTAGVFPTKLFEYLGHRIPVLSTCLPEVMRFAGPQFITLCNEPVSLTLPVFAEQEIDAFVRDHTWEKRIRAYAGAVAEALP